jgi:hypothetical protein
VLAPLQNKAAPPPLPTAAVAQQARAMPAAVVAQGNPVAVALPVAARAPVNMAAAPDPTWSFPEAPAQSLIQPRRPARTSSGRIALLAVGLILASASLAATIFWKAAPKSAGNTPGGVDVHKPTPAEPEPKKDSTDWVKLFNGRDLTGWKQHPASRGEWQVEDRLLVGRGPVHSYLFSERGDYKDFHFRVVAMINHGGNSGQLFRANFAPAYPACLEAQINSTDRDPNRTGSLCGALSVPIRARLVPPNTWFTQEVIAVKNHIVIKVNDQIVVDILAEPGRARLQGGHLALQSFTPKTEVKFAQLEVKELSDALAP